MECTKLLKEIYEDKDGQRKEEVALLSGPNEFVEFYNRLKQIKEFYKKHPNEVKEYINRQLLMYISLFSSTRFPFRCRWNLMNWQNNEKMVLMKQIVNIFNTYTWEC